MSTTKCLNILVLLCACLMLIAMPGPCNPAEDAPEKPAPPATRAVEVSLNDESSKQALPCRITYRLGEDACPIIIFSHGAGGGRETYSYLAKYWAEHGYICLQPSHYDSIQYNRERGQPYSFIAEMKKIPQDVQGWKSRVHDIEVVLNNLPWLNEQPLIANRLDVSRVGVGGHSYGAFTSLLIGGATLPSPAQPNQTEVDERVQAIIAISPQGLRAKGDNRLGFDNAGELRTVRVPAMFITGDCDETTWNTADQRTQAFEDVPAGDKYLAIISGASHMTFAGPHAAAGRVGNSLWQRARTDVGKPPYGNEDEHRTLVCEVSTKFWDAYLKGDHSAKEFLHADGLQKLLSGKGTAKSR